MLPYLWISEQSRASHTGLFDILTEHEWNGVDTAHINSTEPEVNGTPMRRNFRTISSSSFWAKPVSHNFEHQELLKSRIHWVIVMIIRVKIWKGKQNTKEV
jgi:hypothetical protein